jgi:hypothetical protein
MQPGTHELQTRGPVHADHRHPLEATEAHMRQRTLNGLILLAALGSSACVASTAANRPQTTAAEPTEDQAAGELRDHHRHHHRGGVLQFVAMGLDTLGPDDTRRPQIERLQRDMHVCMAPTSGIHRRLLTAIAEGVAAGAVDAMKFEPIVGDLDTTAAAIQVCGVDSQNRLHALLSPVEREDLVDKVLAHWEVWRQVNTEEQVEAREPGADRDPDRPAGLVHRDGQAGLLRGACGVLVREPVALPGRTHLAHLPRGAQVPPRSPRRRAGPAPLRSRKPGRLLQAVGVDRDPAVEGAAGRVGRAGVIESSRPCGLQSAGTPEATPCA